MKHFIYTTYDHKPPRDGSGMKRTMTLYQIIRGEPRRIGHTTDTFKQGLQMAVEMMEQRKLLPKWAFKRHENGGRMYYFSDQFKAVGLCTIHEV